MTAADRRAWLGTQLEQAARSLDVTATGAPVFSWRDRTIGTRVWTSDGEGCGSSEVSAEECVTCGFARVLIA